MNGFFLHTGNRLESLADELARVVAVPSGSGSPFLPEIVMVQSLGMHRWVSLQLARRLGICMNCEFPFPRAFLDETLRELAPEMAPPEAFSTEAMTWKIHRLLPALLDRPEFAPVRHYVGGRADGADGDAIKRYQLAARLANLFDQYLLYRPAMLLDWERAIPAPEGGRQPDLFQPIGDEAWQAALWRELNRERLPHFGAVLERLERSTQGRTGQEGPRISIFGISSLPPAQVALFFHLAATRPVHLFLLAPSSEYHGDDLTPKQRARRGLSAGNGGDGNPLLTSLGRLNAHFTELLLETNERAGHRIVDETEQFTEPPTDTLLHRLQRDILLARDPAAEPEEGEEAQPVPAVSPDDRSLEIHVCHSPMREVEVLYDQLLSMLEENPATPRLLPRDILVMTPDIEKYAPFIQAVFGYPEEEGNAALRIPFSVADRHPRSESLVIDTFLQLLELPAARCTAPQLQSLLQSEPLRRKFRFGEADLEQIRRWIEGSGIRWGLDAGHRGDLGFPAFTENTWRHGMDRLLLGFAMPGENRTLFEGILPHDDVEGNGVELLGRLAAALEAISTTFRELRQPRPPQEWPAALETVIDRFFHADGEAASTGEAEAALRLRELCGPQGEFAAALRAAGEREPLAFEVIREHLTRLLEQAEQRGRFLTGGVTFCALKPMRSIPARVIWLLGMDDEAFPRKPQPLQFDLMARHWKLGDRSTRDDDRYLFLEALLSARDRLGISFVGRSQFNNETSPPSVVVSELLDYLETAAPLPDGEEGSLRQRLVFEHRLQAFSGRYFEPGSPLFSYSAANAAACAAVRRGTARRRPLFAETPLPPPEAEERIVALDQFLDFFARPAAFFLRHRLGMRLEETGGTLAENEPMDLDALSAYGIRSERFEAHRQAGNHAAPEPDTRLYTARALIPPGNLGSQHLRKIDRDAGAFHARLVPLLGETGLPGKPLPVDLRVGEFLLAGSLGPMYGGRLLLFRPATLKPKDRLRAWISHLVRCALPHSGSAGSADSAGETPSTVLAGEDAAVEFLAPDCPAAELLAELLAIYHDGLSRPVPFFPGASFRFAQATLAPPSARRTRTPLDAARAEWEGGFGQSAERDHPAYRLCFGERDPLDGEFERLALAVFGPMADATRPFQEKEAAR